ncbi:unnamed protein product [Peronospora destructor]|uniref:Tf2-1-like SH3-like domain-containing protein n=1 Tax=Peronospora destructor TaxID=86335 RepID=A0AAV0TMP5_9STRA|nr:unnamed protein product [Peronospora destructor]
MWRHIAWRLPKIPAHPIDDAAISDFLLHRQSVTRYVRDALQEAVDKQKENADKRGRKNMDTFWIGDKVLLSTGGLRNSAVTNLGASKLTPRFIGPFTILKTIGDAYTPDIPTSLLLHLTFYVGRLKRYNPAQIPEDARLVESLLIRLAYLSSSLLNSSSTLRSLLSLLLGIGRPVDRYIHIVLGNQDAGHIVVMAPITRGLCWRRPLDRGPYSWAREPSSRIIGFTKLTYLVCAPISRPMAWSKKAAVKGTSGRPEVNENDNDALVNVNENDALLNVITVVENTDQNGVANESPPDVQTPAMTGPAVVNESQHRHD